MTAPRASSFGSMVLLASALAACFDARPGAFVEPGDVNAESERRGALSVSPSLVDFGTLCPGQLAVRTVVVRNEGTEAVELRAALSEVGRGEAFAATLPDGEGRLEPGQSCEVEVRYRPRDTGVSRGDLELSALDGGPAASVALAGQAGGAELLVVPAALELGTVPVGEESRAGLELRSTGSGSLSLQLPRLESPLAEGELDFVGVADRVWPRSLETGQSIDFEVRLAPEAYLDPKGGPIGEVVLKTNACAGAEARVPIYGFPGGPVETCPGEGTLRADRFTGRAAGDVDVLFVVDDSESMADEQAKLADNFEQFIELATALGVDYRIGVTTTDMDTVRGALRGPDPIVTPETWPHFATLVHVGIWGSKNEQGLAAAAASLEAPDGIGAYLRPEALLVLIFVSDEQDKSPGPWGDYLAAFIEAKGGEPERLLVNAIVGPWAGCQTANHGPRYIAVAEATGGAVASICEPTFADTMLDFGEASFGAKTTFVLSGPAVPGTVTVEVAGAACEEGWALTPDGSKVRFEPDADCLPDAGEAVVISYELNCEP